MKRFIYFLIFAALAFAVGLLVANHQQSARYAIELQQQRALWDKEKSALQTTASSANSPSMVPVPLPIVQKADTTTAPDALALLNQLKTLKPSPDQGQVMRKVFVLLDQLSRIGPSALSAISDFLATGQDVEYVAPGGKNPRDGKFLMAALVPPTLRVALFDVVRQISGADAESILVENLNKTVRGIEVACLTQVLEQMAPGRYQENILSTTHTLLTDSRVSDVLDLEFLFGVLERFNDTTFVATANSQLIRPDGQIDRDALNYLKQSLGEQSIALAAQLYQDNRLSDPGSKEPLARVALAYVGANTQAEDLYHAAILDPTLQPDQRRNLVEDLNQDGLSNRKNPTADDLKIIANRYALTEAYLQQDYVQNDKILNAAFHEADKDLHNMLQKAAAAQAAH